jgi:hypothetical protein
MFCHNKQGPSLIRRGRKRIRFHIGSEEHTSVDRSPSVTTAAYAGVKTPAYRWASGASLLRPWPHGCYPSGIGRPGIHPRQPGSLSGAGF